MIAEIGTMPDQARLWVYQADRKLTGDEITRVIIATEAFLENWAAHGHALKAAYSIEFDQFLIVTVDESVSAASGCSIDASVGLIRGLEMELQISFLDRSKVALLEDGRVSLQPLNAVKSLISEGVISKDTQVINNSVSTYGDWKQSWIQSAENSWMNRFFN